MSGERRVVRMPPIGESVTEGVVVRFLKKPGDAVKRDEPMLEVDTDKVTIELQAPEDGVIESLAVAEGTVVPIDQPLYVLRTGSAAVTTGQATAQASPSFASVTLRWDAGHVQTRARGLGEPRVAEAALISTALVRSLAAGLGLLHHGQVAITWIDLEGDSARWVCAPLALDVRVVEAVALARVGLPGPPPGWRAQLSVVRLHGGAASTARLHRQDGLQVVIGPVRDEAVVIAGAVVVRPMATISVADDAGGTALLRFVAVLAEQLGQV